MKVNDNVKYRGETRPYLKNMNGVIQSGPSENGGYLVKFTSPYTDLSYTEWVGSRALDLVSTSVIADARAKVLDRIRDLEKQISVLRSEVSKLNAANKALKSME